MTGESFEILGDPAALRETPIVATAIHAGHDLRGEVAARMALDEGTRLREEDPFTDVVARGFDVHVVVHRSRFEVDLNRDRDGSVYRRPEDAWGLEVWDGEPADDLVERSRQLHDGFYAAMAALLDPLAAAGPFVVLDVHSYNHRRCGPDAEPEPAEANPEVNVGTGSMDRSRWAPVVDRFVDSLRGVDLGRGPLDVRENVRFRGGHLSRWVHQRYPAAGCALAVELKKTFMDEWTGEPDRRHLEALREVVVATVPTLLGALAEVDAGAVEPSPVR